MARTLSVAAPKLLTALLAYELSQDFCRNSKTLLGGDGADVIVEIAELLALTTETAVSSAADAGNAGNGALALANPAVAAGTVPGNYRVVFVEPAANAGTFVVIDPHGVVVGKGTVAVAYAGPVKFTIADGGNDFAAGDGFTITVPGDGTKLVPWNPTALDGSALVDSVVLKRTIAPDGVDTPILVMERGPAILKADGIEWPEGATDDQKAAAIATLKSKGILVQ